MCRLYVEALGNDLRRGTHAGKYSIGKSLWTGLLGTYSNNDYALDYI